MDEIQIGNKMPYAAKMRVRGKLPQKRDIVDWGNTKLLAFLRFVDFFTENGKFNCSISRVTEARLRGEDELFWDEFLERINVIQGIDDGTSLKFRLRLTSLARIPLSWIKSNLHAVTPEMMEIMQKNPRLSWASSAFKLVTTETGAQVVERDNDEKTDPRIKNENPAMSNVSAPLVKFEQAKMNMLTLLMDLSKSIPKSELNKMSVKDKITAFDKLLNTAAKIIGKTHPNSIVFQQINVNKASREELEKSFLSYAESQEV